MKAIKRYSKLLMTMSRNLLILINFQLKKEKRLLKISKTIMTSRYSLKSKLFLMHIKIAHLSEMTNRDIIL